MRNECCSKIVVGPFPADTIYYRKSGNPEQEIRVDVPKGVNPSDVITELPDDDRGDTKS